jgi:fatty acid desaturase
MMAPEQRYALNTVIMVAGSLAAALGVLVLYIWWATVWPWALLGIPIVFVGTIIFLALYDLYESSVREYQHLSKEEKAKYIKPEPRVQDSKKRRFRA